MAAPRSVTVSKAVAAAANYAAADILSESATNGAGTAWTFSNIGPSGRAITITTALMTCTEDSVVFRGRENAHVDEGFKVAQNFVEKVQDIARVESGPSLQGRRIVMIVVPK